MTVIRVLALLFAVAVFTAAPVYSRLVSETDAGEMDVCGRDPLVTDKMRENPREVIEYLVNRPENQEIQKMLNNHPFVEKVEAGKLTKDELRDDVVANLAYHLDRQVRNFGQALNNFGNAWPVMERREMIGDVLDMHRGELRRLGPLAEAVGIDRWEALLKAEPNADALVLSSHMAEIVNHGRDIAEGLAAIRVNLGTEISNRKRIQKALRENPAYKTFGLDEKALGYYDVEIDVNEFDKGLDQIIRQALDDGITLCELRRRVNQVNVGYLRLYDGMNGERTLGGEVRDGWF